MFPNLSVPKPRPPNVRVPLVRVIQWGFLPTKYSFPYFEVSSSFLSINMCLPQRKHLNPHLPKAKLPLCHSQAFIQRGATTWQLLLQVPLWTSVLRVLIQQNEEMAPPWVTCVVSELPSCVSTSQVMQEVFLRRDCKGSTGLARRKKSLKHGMTVTSTKWCQEFWVQHTNFFISHQLWDFISASMILLYF